MIQWITLALAAAAAVLGVVNLLRGPRTDTLERLVLDEMRASRREISESIETSMSRAAKSQRESVQQMAEAQDRRLRTIDESLERVRLDTARKVSEMQQSNEKKLEQMRVTVDEKLQRTLDERLKQSFSRVDAQLQQVYKGLGEMQELATGVGDLKKVLSNVKTRGILGEIQLGAILEEILPAEQYAADIATVKGSAERVEYAIKLPGAAEGESVWLPIDAKFPMDAYAGLLEAYDAGDKAAVAAAAKVLEQRMLVFAKDISQKYIHVPETTEFGIMFLPVEGLYAEVVRLGLVERLQREHKVNIAGPTTLAALLNSLQMGFRTLAIQKRSGEVWKVLHDVRSEFGKFESALMQTQRRLNQASSDLEQLVGVRTRQIQRRLKGMTRLEDTAGEEEEIPALPEGDMETDGE